MTDIIAMIYREREEVQKVYEIARNASQKQASAEFFQATKGFFGIIKPDGKPSYQVTYVNNRWAPLVSLLEDPTVRRFLNRTIADRYFAMVPRDAAVGLLLDLDPRYRKELAPELEGLSARVSNRRPFRFVRIRVTDRTPGNLEYQHSDTACEDGE